MSARLGGSVFGTGLSRRQFAQVALVTVAAPFAAAGLSGCAASVAAAPETMPLLDYLATTAIASFAAEAGKLAADALPGFMVSAVDALDKVVKHHSTPQLQIVPGPVPRYQLEGLVHALTADSDHNIEAHTVHLACECPPLLIPSVVQLALNCLTAREIGYGGEFFESAPKRMPTAADIAGLRKSNSIRTCTKVSGSVHVQKSSSWTTETYLYQHIDIQWVPATEPGHDCHLTVQKGAKPQGSRPEWETQASFSIPYHYVFGDPPSS
ncbi:MAG TPA: hypothetical protein VMB79_08365 [Jatrophihabitans sp.]|nr:hypothetical protein [Jatrophihabitans sp.]